MYIIKTFYVSYINIFIVLFFVVFSQHHPNSLDLANINKTIFSSLPNKDKHVSCKYSPQTISNITSVEPFKTVLKLQPWASIFLIPLSALSCVHFYDILLGIVYLLGLLVSLTSKRIINRAVAYTA